MIHITPESAGWGYIGFSVYRLQTGEVVELPGSDVEQTVIVLEGSCAIVAGGTSFAHVGSRASVFDDESPEAVYSPPHTHVTVTALSRTEVAVATAKTDQGVGGPRLIGKADIPYERRGSGSTERRVRHLLDEHHPAHKLLLVEVITPAGNWSSYPPHKHDAEMDLEAYLEETYYYRVAPKHGNALQRVYDKQGLNEVLLPSDGDVVLVPKGYHPVAAPPGFDTYYLNVMAGHNRVWKYTLDEDYAHIAPKGGNIMGEINNESSSQR